MLCATTNRTGSQTRAYDFTVSKANYCTTKEKVFREEISKTLLIIRVLEICDKNKQNIHVLRVRPWGVTFPEGNR